ncbi:MAG: hypothetical protein ACRELX_07715 [Longimicrobiales bacterium]
MRSFLVQLAVYSTLLCAPTAAQQEKAPVREPYAWRVTVAPRFGVFVPDKGMGDADLGGPALTMTSSPTAGLDVELRTPVRWFSLRALAETSVGSQLAELVPISEASCGTSCGPSETTELAVGESSVLTFAADAMLRPWHGTTSRFQPFGFLGGGLKRYDLTHGNRTLEGGQESAFTLHFGGGIEIPAGPVHLSFEAADYMSVLRTTVRSTTPAIFVDAAPGPPAEATLKHDFFLTLGVRLFPH